MYKFVVAVFVICVFKDVASYSCFRNTPAEPCPCSGDNGQCMVSCGGSCGGPFCSRTSNNLDYSCSCGCESPVCSCLKTLNQDCGIITSSSCGCNSYNTGSSCGCNSYNLPSNCGCNSYKILVPSSCGYSSVPSCDCGCNSYNMPRSCGCNSYNSGSSCGCSSCIRDSCCGTPTIYFPEVEYPVAMCGVPAASCRCGDENPFYYGVYWDN